MSNIKPCKCCGDPKPLSEFSKHRTNLDGLANTCKSCCNNQQRERYKSKKAKQQKEEAVNELVVQDISFYGF